LPKLLFPRGVGGVHTCTCNAHRNSGGVEGYFCVQKMEIPGKRGGGGMVWYFDTNIWEIIFILTYLKRT